MENTFANHDDVEVIYLDDEDSDLMKEIIGEENLDEEANEANGLDVSKLTFNRHSKSVFCGDLSNDGQFAVTGGEDDSAYLWLCSTGDVRLECTGHKDSVTSVCFNHDSKLLATADMSGMIQVWDLKSSKLIWCHQGDDMEWLMWHSVTNVLLSGSHSGEVYIWQVPQGNCKVLMSPGSLCLSGKLLPDGKHLLVGYENGLVKLWDIKGTCAKWQFLDVQTPTVTSIEINSDATLCSLAPSSNLLKMFDGKSVGILLAEGETDIEAHIFSKELNILITGSLGGRICVWDLHSYTIRQEVKLDCGITILKLGFNQKAFVGTTQGPVYVCDIRNGVLDEIFTGHKASILSISVSCNGLFILTTSDDETAKIFSISQT